MSKSAVVTGAASGIGLGMAQVLIQDGYKVLLTDINGEALDAAVAELGQNAYALQGDIADPALIETLAAQAFNTFGTVDLVFANAGVSTGAPLLKATPEQFDLIFGVNTKGAWLTAKAFANRWQETGASGRICITGSEHSLGFQHAGVGLYTASKHAILGLGDVLRRELPDTISLSVYCPGIVATNIYDQSHIDGVAEIPDAAKAYGAAIMAHGMSPTSAARKAIEGTLRGDFLIVTHAVARDGAEERWRAIDTAFATQAPPDETSEQYRIPKIVAAVRAEFKSRQE